MHARAFLVVDVFGSVVDGVGGCHHRRRLAVLSLPHQVWLNAISSSVGSSSTFQPTKK